MKDINYKRLADHYYKCVGTVVPNGTLEDLSRTFEILLNRSEDDDIVSLEEKIAKVNNVPVKNVEGDREKKVYETHPDKTHSDYMKGDNK